MHSINQPPKNSEWDFDSFHKCINPNTFTFKTKIQNIHQIQHRTGLPCTFYKELRKFWSERGERFSQPCVLDIPMDLYRLDVEVKKLGGYEKVMSTNAWRSIGVSLNLIHPTDDMAMVTIAQEEIEKGYKMYIHLFNVAKESNSLLIPRTVEKQRTCGDGRKGVDDEELGIQERFNKKRRLENGNEKMVNIVKQSKKSLENRPLWQEVRSLSFSGEESSCSSSYVPIFGSAPSYKQQDQLLIDTSDFGYATGRSYTLNEYQEMAQRYELLVSENKTLWEKEREYWRIVQSGDEWVQVQYGSDLDVAQHGSGFPFNPNCEDENHRKRATTFLRGCRRKKQKQASSNYMMRSGWNVNNLSEATFLHHMQEDVAGVTRPMLYVGMLYSSFCWHTEDNYLYSINYLHTGQPKRWYGVPCSAAENFEKAMKKHLPLLFQNHPNLLYLLVTQMSPSLLLAEGVPVFTALQSTGQFVVTSPRAYHAGWNTGFNVAESVNFALEDWLPLCRIACDHYRYLRSAVFPYEEIVVKACANPDNAGIASLLKQELVYIMKREARLLKNLLIKGVNQYIKIKETYKSCKSCGYDCFLSGIVCNNHPGEIVCLEDMPNLCSCEVTHKRLLIRISLQSLKDLHDNLCVYLTNTCD
eukprot:TRINITY_DN1995_c0_g1_i22.p1 TRINITY_DN1995_c0_g1~~TRINITY_DN1995_c0_g1_i22.p1  ORF type:complete len:640 (+),score=101.97 TRINITY_DN1995_c0_g1_i22:270-2189(+)